MSQNIMAKIEAGEKSIADVFSKKYAFSIPPYQRPYAWEVPQVSALIEDLLDAMNPQNGASDLYFLGSIVLVKTPGDPAAKVVDGQQRLTTLTILISVLRDLTEDQNSKTSRGMYVKQPADTDLQLPEQLRLQLRPKDQPFFRDHVQADGATETLPSLASVEGSRARIVENTSELRSKLGAMTEEERTKLISFILRNCFFVVVEVPTDKAARRIFTVLNARGMDLSATDILKADLLERSGEEKELELSTAWEDLERALDRRLFSDLFTHIRMIFQREKPRSALEVGFPEFVPPFKENPDEFVSKTLSPYADALLEIEQNQSRLNSQFGLATANLINSLNRLDNKDWVPPLLLCLKLRNENDEFDIVTFIEKLERLAYYLFVTRSDVNTRMFRYADVINSVDPKQGYKAKTGGLELDKGEINHFFDALDGPIYRLNRVVKPVLLRLDQALNEASAIYDFSVISVEHICPQTIKVGSQWDEHFADRDLHEHWLHKLGNLALLSHRKNARASNWDFTRKKESYFTKDDSTPFMLTKQIIDESEWTLSSIENRQQDLLQTLANSWKLSDQYNEWSAI